MFNKIEIRLSGSGGQGVILAAIILADAAIEQGINAIQTQSYGPEARGGSSNAEVIISKHEIKFPKVTNANILLALTQNSYDKYIATLSKNGILVVDESVNVITDAPYTIYKLPILDTAQNKIGTHMVSNIVSVGVLYALIGEDVISKDVMLKSIIDRVPPVTVDKNISAFEEGIKLIRG
ncbi:MAG: 2-oxoacid:acceptor oxidoreductase family protein [Sedimentibacter sp.]|uniref:2-oxoacid:acceptor oxidoreductase family protein n=1 Tax=Sedimentibacter sp. TaxID=1960295 RepID=UPI002981B520|nr:2-oxoacid:acceptor oxidoreductase family protein [Sedimentibacter sp.]MDW5299864.1 2-oxoacid:acceptor oxidoreductase family protein [Sedimentibacter sp.]